MGGLILRGKVFDVIDSSVRAQLRILALVLVKGFKMRVVPTNN
jgi:hypothetical protein